MDSKKGYDTSKKPEIDTTQNTQIDSKLSHSSSTSSKSSEENLFQLDTNPNPNSNIPSVKTHAKPPLSPQISLCTPKSDYDPNRIPVDVFHRSKSGTEWSIASNESLFSIHIGKSDELSGYYNSPMNYSPLSPSVGHSDCLEIDPGTSLGEGKETSEKKAGKSVVFVLDEGGKGRESTSGISVDGSVASHQSFAFPILAGEGRPSEASKSDTGHHQSENEQNKSENEPLTPPSQKDGSSDDQKSEAENKNNNSNNGGWFSCFSWLPASCRWGN